MGVFVFSRRRRAGRSQCSTGLWSSQLVTSDDDKGRTGRVDMIVGLSPFSPGNDRI